MTDLLANLPLEFIVAIVAASVFVVAGGVLAFRVN